jgi:hypothetical protein
VTVYFIQSDCGRVKIGYTGSETAEGRLRDLQVGSPRKLTLLVQCEGSRRQETLLHRKLADSNPHGEWFEPTTKLASVIAFAKRFGNVSRWDEAEENPEAWAEMRAAVGRCPGLALEVEEAMLQHRWEQEMVKQAARVRRDVDWLWAWESSAGPARDLSRLVEHRIAEYSGEPDSFEWVESSGRRSRGVGLEATVERLLHKKTDDQRAAAIWILACIHELSRSEGERQQLARCLPELEKFYSELYARTECGWMHLQNALPQKMLLPRRCILGIEEFVTLCARHCRILLIGATIRMTWRHGSACGTVSLRPEFDQGPIRQRMPFQIGATP